VILDPLPSSSGSKLEAELDQPCFENDVRVVPFDEAMPPQELMRGECLCKDGSDVLDKGKQRRSGSKTPYQEG